MDSTFLAQIFVSVVSKSFHSMIAALLKLCPGWILTKEENLGDYKSTEWFRQQHCAYVHQEREGLLSSLPTDALHPARQHSCIGFVVSSPV